MSQGNATFGKPKDIHLRYITLDFQQNKKKLVRTNETSEDTLNIILKEALIPATFVENIAGLIMLFTYMSPNITDNKVEPFQV